MSHVSYETSKALEKDCQILSSHKAQQVFVISTTTFYIQYVHKYQGHHM